MLLALASVGCGGSSELTPKTASGQAGYYDKEAPAEVAPMAMSESVTDESAPAPMVQQ